MPNDNTLYNCIMQKKKRLGCLVFLYFLINFINKVDLNTFWTQHFRTPALGQTDLLFYELNEEFVFKSIFDYILILPVRIVCGRALMGVHVHMCSETTLGTSCSKLQWWSMTVRIAHTISWTSTLLQCYVWWHRIKRLKDTRSKVAKYLA